MKAITVDNRQKVSEFSLLSAIVNEKITFSCSTQDDLNPRSRIVLILLCAEVELGQWKNQKALTNIDMDGWGKEEEIKTNNKRNKKF